MIAPRRVLQRVMVYPVMLEKVVALESTEGMLKGLTTCKGSVEKYIS